MTSHEDRRRSIAEAAADLFASQGYQNTSMDDIARSVATSKPTLYHYFRSKSEILYWIHEDFLAFLTTRYERRQSTPMPASQFVFELMADVLELVSVRRSYVRVFFEHYRDLDSIDRSTIRQRRMMYEEFLESALKRARDAGELRADLDIRLAAYAIFGMCNWAYQWNRSGSPEESRLIAYTFWDYLFRGVGRQPGDRSNGGVDLAPTFRASAEAEAE